MEGVAVSNDERSLLREAQAVAEARGGALLSLTTEIERFDAVAAFQAASSEQVVTLWEQPSRGRAMLAVGRAWQAQVSGPRRFEDAGIAVEALRRMTPAQQDGAPTVLGGFGFSADGTRAGHWQRHGDGRLHVPEVLLSVDSGETRLTRSLLVAPGEQPQAAWERLTLLAQRLTGSSIRHERSTGPHGVPSSRADWTDSVREAIEVIEAGALSKVVLAREVTFAGVEGVSVANALEALREGYPSCTTFAVRDGDTCFLGASPEPLISVQGGRCTTMALAGSVRRGANPEEDAEIAAAFLEDAKENAEHSLVVDVIARALAETCASLTYPARPQLLRMANVQHLCTPFEGELRPGVSVLDLVERLHPTPSVAGAPLAEAMDLIQRSEGFDRGWYAGPVGWFDLQGSGEFVVALRSALLTGDTARLYAGCGIVAGSEPEQELAESELKLRPMRCALKLS